MTLTLLPEDRAKVLAALDALQTALNAGDRAQAERAAKEARGIVGDYQRLLRGEPYLTPTAQDLEAKRRARLYAEEWETMSQRERDAFNRLYGERATLRRLAAAAQQQADERWAKRETAKLNAEYEQDMWQGHADRNQLPGANYDKLERQAAALEAKRKERLKAREQRALLAEDYDEEQPRILASMDAEEQAIFQELVMGLPSPLDRLRAFRAAMAHNELEGIEDPETLYRLAEEADPATRRPASPPPDISEVNDVNQLYDIGLNQILEEE